MVQRAGLLRARRQNVPSHTVARIGGQLQDHHHMQQQQQNMFTMAVSPPPLQQAAATTAAAGGGPQPQASDLAAMVDLTSDNRGTPIDYLTPPPNGDFQFQNFQPTTVGGGAVESITMAHAESQQSNQLQNTAQAPSPPPFAQLTASAATTSPFTPSGGGFQPPSPMQTSSPSNQVHSLTFANNNNNGPFEQFTPFSPTLTHEPVVTTNHHQQQPPHQQHQQPNGVSSGRWELGFDANEILTPPFSGGSAPEQSGGGGGGGGQSFFQQDFGPDAAGSAVRNNKQFLGGGVFFGGGGFDTSNHNNNNKFTPLDAVVRSSASFTSPSNNNNVYWGTPKTAQQLQPLRPSPTFAEPNAFRFNNNNNHPHPHHLHPPGNHLHQYADAFHQMPFTGQFDGPLSQGTVADHVVHSSIRIKRQLQRDESDNDDGDAPAVDNRREDSADNDDNDDDDVHQRFGDRKPVYSYVKTDRNGNFKWSVRHGY